MELNPNHPVTRTMAGQWHKIVALLMVKFGRSHIEISLDEITKALTGDMKAVTIRERDNVIVLDLVSMKEAERLAKEEGGLPA
jgi:hypothetical protein